MVRDRVRARVRFRVRASVSVRVRLGSWSGLGPRVRVRVRVQMGWHGVMDCLYLRCFLLCLFSRPDRLSLPLKERQEVEEEGFHASKRHKLFLMDTQSPKHCDEFFSGDSPSVRSQEV